MKRQPALVTLACCCLLVAAVLFAVHSSAGPLPQHKSQTQNITCSSDDMQRHTCEVDARGGAQLTRQISNSPCIFGRTWGYDGRGIGVDRGCRADFEVLSPRR